MEEIKQTLELKANLDAIRPIDKEQENRIMQKFRLDWNYHSNHLEGNSLTYGETKALLLFGITAQGKPLKDTLEIRGHNEAINWVLEMIEGERPLTENFIRELHSLLLQDSYKNSKTTDGKIVPRKITSGKYKTTPNHVETVTGEMFYFASPEETPAKMYDLLNWYNKKIEENKINPLLVAAEFHYKFIAIHPFDDGNGRTARILMNFILMQFGYPPVIIKTEDKANYFAALQQADAGNIEPFISYIAVNLNRSLQIMIAGANGEEIEEEDDLDKEIALLEQKLSHFGEKIEKINSPENINDIFINTIKKLVFEIKEKLQIFEKHYLTKILVINIDNESFILSELPIVLEKNILKINIYLNYRSIRTEGLENFSFEYSFNFKFNELNYSVFINDDHNNTIYTKNYINLSENDRKSLLKAIVNSHSSALNKFLI